MSDSSFDNHREQPLILQFDALMPENNSIVAVDAVLPQTQCRQCGYDGCLAYAIDIIKKGAPINRCAPGGAAGIKALAQVTARPVLELDPDYGQEMPFAIAKIKATDCIGCSWCTRVCPTDAIVGSPKHLHAILEADCTGCALCLPTCPMDCIELVEQTERVWGDDDKNRARTLYRQTAIRRENFARHLDEKLTKRRDVGVANQDKKSFVADIMKLARAQRVRRDNS